MSTEEKPLHVQVAEALGCRAPLGACIDWPHYHCTCYSARHVGRNGCAITLADYDTDWSATGPLIEKYDLCVWSDAPMRWLKGDGPEGTPLKEWRCNTDMNGLQLEGSVSGATPLIAVCNLILAIKAAGKLPA